MSDDRLVLSLVEYVAGKATYEDRSGYARLVLPRREWDAMGRPFSVRVTVEAYQ